MNKDELIELLQRQVGFLQARLDEASATIARMGCTVEELNATIARLTGTIEELRQQIASLEGAVSAKDEASAKDKAMLRAMRRLQESPSERQMTAETARTIPKPRAKTNNGAKRDKHPECKTVRVEVEPDAHGFDPAQAELIGLSEVVRYCYKPAQFIKVVYLLRKYKQQGKIYRGEAPDAPLRNSQYTSSFVAGLTELRYLCGLPVEAAVKHFNAHGFGLSGSTAQGLVAKTTRLLGNLYKALGEAVLEDSYICGDETYTKVRLQEPTDKGKRVKKGYTWGFVGMTTGLVYYFYDDGSRSAQVFEERIRGFKGAFQCDYYSAYRNLGVGDMAGITRLPCLQHIKRRFLDLKDNPVAMEIAGMFNELYRCEHRHTIGKDGWTDDDHLRWRQKYSADILQRIHKRLVEVVDRPAVPPADPLSEAARHALKQWHEIPRIFTSPIYRLDNNEVERANRYVALPRHRLTSGSHAGAEASALYLSLAITCQRCGVNYYDYMCDIIDRCAAMPPTTPIERYRSLLPDRWQPAQRPTNPAT